MKLDRVYAIALGIVLGSYAPNMARACTCSNTVNAMLPAAGAQGVYLDIAPVFAAGFVAPETIRWTSATGTAVDFEVRTGFQGPCSGLFELIPRAALEPNTRYVIDAQLANVDPASPEAAQRRIEFTTGSERTPELPLAVPSAVLSVVYLEESRGSCESLAHACAAVGDAYTEIATRLGDEPLSFTIVRGDVALASFAPERADPNLCVDLRTRDPAGRRSAAQTLCGEQLRARAAVESDFDGLTPICKGGRFGGDAEASAPADDGCATSRKPDGGFVWVLLALLGARRRPRARRSA